jgi:PIN domain nuclease of toxin-antitoxin system
VVAVRRSAPTAGGARSDRCVREIAVKRAAGRLEAPDDLLEAIEANDFETLPITAIHAVLAGGLPAHHSDPFDRMLIAQARAETLTLVSVDGRFPQYDVELLPLS